MNPTEKWQKIQKGSEVIGGFEVKYTANEAGQVEVDVASSSKNDVTIGAKGKQKGSKGSKAKSSSKGKNPSAPTTTSTAEKKGKGKGKAKGGKPKDSVGGKKGGKGTGKLGETSAPATGKWSRASSKGPKGSSAR